MECKMFTSHQSNLLKINASDIDKIVFFTTIYYFIFSPIIEFLEYADKIPHLPLSIIFYFLPASFVVCFYIYNFFINHGKIFKNNLIVISIFLYLLAVITFNFPYKNYEVFRDNALVLLHFIFAYSLGLRIIDIDKYNKTLSIIFILVSLFWISYIDWSTYRIDFSLMISDDKIANYLNMGDGYAILSIILIYLNRTKPFLASLITVLSIMILFAMNSRSAVFIYILVLFVPLIFYGRKYRLVILSGMLLSIFFVLSMIDLDILLDTRVLQIIISPETDGSYLTRLSLMQKGISDLKYDWLWGNYQGYVTKTGPGSYIHNYLSFWLQYGVIPFAMTCFIAIRTLVSCFKNYIFGNQKQVFPIMLLTYTILGCCISKGYVYVSIWFALGVAISSLSYIKTHSPMQRI